MRFTCPTLAVAALAMGIALPARGAAQSVPSPYSFIEQRQEVGLFTGHISANTGRFGYGPSGGTMFGARYGLELSGPLSIEAVSGLVSGTRDIVNPGRPENDRVVGPADVLLAAIDGRLKLTATGARSWHGLSPFIVLGGGVVWDVAAKPELDANLDEADVFTFGTSFFGTAGAGTRWFLTRHFALRTDAIFSLWKLKTPTGFADPLRDFGAVEKGEWVRGLSVTASLLYRW